jgi:hypothetical protein
MGYRHGHRFTDEEADRIRRLAGNVRAHVIAHRLGLKYSSLKEWASEHGISLRMPRLTGRTAIYHRLAEMARVVGMRLSWRRDRISILVTVAEDLSVTEAEEFLKAANGKKRHDAVAVAYDRATVNGHSLGAAWLDWQAHERLRDAFTPKLGGICCPQVVVQ